MLIQSKDNGIFKQYRLLAVSKHSNKSDYFLIEGIREISLALKAGIFIESIVLKQNDNNSAEELKTFIGSSIPTYYFVSDLFMRLSVRKSGANALAIAKKPKPRVHNDSKLVLVLENIEKPGNLGAIARSADALGVNDIIVTGSSINIYNPNVIRSSLGAIFVLNITSMSNEDCFKYLLNGQYNIIVTDLESNLDYRKIDYAKKTAIVMGSEASGITDFWLKAAHQRVIIPMVGQVNSMNLSVSSAIMMATALSGLSSN